MRRIGSLLGSRSADCRRLTSLRRPIHRTARFMLLERAMIGLRRPTHSIGQTGTTDSLKMRHQSSAILSECCTSDPTSAVCVSFTPRAPPAAQPLCWSNAEQSTFTYHSVDNRAAILAGQVYGDVEVRVKAAMPRWLILSLIWPGGAPSAPGGATGHVPAKKRAMHAMCNTMHTMCNAAVD